MGFQKKIVDFKELMFEDDILFTGVYAETYHNGIEKYECSYKEGLKHGTEWLYYESGLVKEIRTFKNGELRIFEEYYENGGLKTKIEFKDEMKNGIEMSFDDNLEIKSFGTNKNNKKHGQWEFWEKGKLVEVKFFKNDEVVYDLLKDIK